MREGEEWCAWHDPERETDRAEWRQRGGRNRSNKARAKKALADSVMTIADIDALLCRSLVQVAAGRLEPGPANAMATIARTIVAIRTSGELEERLARLEEAAGVTNVRRIG